MLPRNMMLTVLCSLDEDGPSKAKKSKSKKAVEEKMKKVIVSTP